MTESKFDNHFGDLFENTHNLIYFSRQIVIQHGGKMWVESIEGNGSTFYFSLPL